MSGPNRIRRFYGLVLGLILGLAGLCFGVIASARSGDTDSSCLVSKDNRAPIFFDAKHWLYIRLKDSFADPIDDADIVSSPDARYLAYGKHYTDADGQARAMIYVREWNGTTFSRPTPILENMHLWASDIFIYIAWSSDNQWLLVSWKGEDGSSEITITNPDGSEQFTRRDPAILEDWGWTADSAYYGFTGNGVIILWARDSRQFINTGIRAEHLIPAPTGHRFAFISPANDDTVNLILYSPGEEIQHKFPLPNNIWDLEPALSWSPDGQHVVMTSLTSKGLGPDFSWLRLDDYNIDGSMIPHFGDSVNAEITQSVGMGPTLAWSPDSRRVVYVSEAHGIFSIWAYDISLQRFEILATHVSSDFQMVDNTYLITLNGPLPVLLDLRTGERYNIPEEITDLGIERVSSDGHVLAMANNTIRLINMRTSQVLEYVPDGNVFEHRFIWSPDSKQVAIFYATGRGYVLDIVGVDGALLHRLKLPKSVEESLFTHPLGWTPLRWTPCHG